MTDDDISLLRFLGERVDALAGTVELRFTAAENALQAAFAASEKATAAAFAASEKATAAALAAAEKAVSAALAAQEKAVATALSAVDDQTKQHSVAHDREHAAMTHLIATNFSSLDAKMTTSDKNHEIAHAIEREVADRERAAMTIRLEGMNEFRQQLNDQSKMFATTENVNTKFDQLSERLTQNREDILSRLAALERMVTSRNEDTTKHFALNQGGQDLGRWAIPIMITLVIMAITVAGLLTR